MTTENTEVTEPEIKVEKSTKVEEVEKAEETVEEKVEKPVEEPESKEKPDAVQRRINKLTREKHELAQRLADLEAKAKEKSEPVAKKDNESEQEYLDRLVDERVEQKLSERDSKKTQSDKISEMRKAYADRITKFAEVTPDFEEVVYSADVNLPDDVAQEVFLSEKSAELTYYFAKNPEVAKKMGQMTTIGKATEMIRILKDLETPVQKELSKADKPIEDVKGEIIATTDISKMDIDDFIKHRNKIKGR